MQCTTAFCILYLSIAVSVSGDDVMRGVAGPFSQKEEEEGS